MPHFKYSRPLVLVADPSSTNAALIKRQLSWSGFDAITCAGAAEALSHLAERRPAACVIEVMFDAGMKGYEVVRKIRADPANELLPVILMSERAGKLDRDFAFTVGADDYFRKPFCSHDLVARIEALVPRPPVRDLVPAGAVGVDAFEPALLAHS